ncbi:MAG: DUF3783 domain-containing protein [Spirochaetes bacterium]|nr:DUF3783 domain-containing protein [Spirochaetota bacterium]
MKDPQFKTILMHGFTHEEALAVMRVVKQTLKEPNKLIFALSTPQSLQKKLDDLLQELEEEHRAMTEQEGKNP